MKFSKLYANTPEKYGELDVTLVTDNSRMVTKGSVFVCIEGPLSDGHNYAQNAVENGAEVVIAQRDLGLENQIVVEDTHKVYAEMCSIWFGNPLSKLKVIGVTGTNGKTSVTYMLKSILDKTGHKSGVIGTIQNVIGDKILPSKNTTPGIFELQSLFALMVEEGCEYAVMEVSSHALHQRRVEGIEFEVGIFTNLTQDHLDYHGDMENYFAAKKILFENSKIAVINGDDEYGKRLLEEVKCEKVSYSTKSNESTFTAKNIIYKPESVQYQMVGFGVITRIDLKIAGKFSVYNSMAAVATAMELGISGSDISGAIALLEGVKGRAEVVPCDKDFTVIIDYAHTPDGLNNIITTFKECERNRLIVLFGCGGDRDKTKRPKMGAIAGRLADYVIVTSDNPRTEDPGAIIEDIMAGLKGIPTPVKVIENRIKAIEFAIANAKPGDIIILAGKGHETYQIVGTETLHLDEREVVAEALSKSLQE